MRHEQFAKMDFENDESMYLNAVYITAYAYSKEKDKTVVALIGEGQPLYFPGDQTQKIREACNCSDEDRR